MCVGGLCCDGPLQMTAHTCLEAHFLDEMPALSPPTAPLSPPTAPHSPPTAPHSPPPSIYPFRRAAVMSPHSPPGPTRASRASCKSEVSLCGSSMRTRRRCRTIRR